MNTLTLLMSHHRVGAVVLAVLLTVGSTVSHAADNQSASVSQSSSHIIKYRPDMAPGSLLARPDTDIVELNSGRRMRVGDLRRLTAAASRMRSATPKPLPPGLALKPSSKGLPLNHASDLSAALTRRDSDTLQLPSGRTLTVAQLKMLRPQVEEKLGRSLASGGGARPASVIRVTAKSDWKTLLQKPDTTVLEAPDGTWVTVGQLKERLSKSSTKLPPIKQ